MRKINQEHDLQQLAWMSSRCRSRRILTLHYSTVYRRIISQRNKSDAQQTSRRLTSASCGRRPVGSVSGPGQAMMPLRFQQINKTFCSKTLIIS
jgi:hypothetical protein